jgi:flagellar M-ring protein FliF
VMSGLEAADAQAIAAELAAKKIPYLVSPDGTSINVPADQVDAARLEIASHDSPKSGRIGFEIFDKVSWGQTEFDEKVNYQRALEGELERTIQTISNVKSARVHLVMASDSVFIDRERGAKASVTLRLRRGSLSKDELTAISRLVAGAVDELKPSDIAIVDADSDRSLGTGDNPNEVGDGVEAELTKRLVATLAPVVGADAIHATVNIEYETGSSEESQDKYDPAVSAPLNMQHSEEASGPGAGIGGVPGTSSNVARAKGGAPAAAISEPGQSSKTDSATYGVNRTTRHVIEPAGRIRRLTAAVVVDDTTDRKQQGGKWVEIHHKRQPADMLLISQLAQAAIGFDSTRGDVISVQNLTFDHPAAEDIPPLAFADKARKGLEDYSAVVRYAVLLLLFTMVYVLMIRPIQRRAFAAPMQLAVQETAGQLEAKPVERDDAALLSQRALVLKQQLTDFVRTEPESSATAVRAWLREDTP